jgi:hypothetical protein
MKALLGLRFRGGGLNYFFANKSESDRSVEDKFAVFGRIRLHKNSVFSLATKYLRGIFY